MLCVLSVFVDESGYGVSMPVSQERMMNSGKKAINKRVDQFLVSSGETTTLMSGSNEVLGLHA